MKKLSVVLLRVGLAITFLWIGWMILQNPAGWARSIKPSVAEMLPVDPTFLLQQTGYLDMAVGVMLLINPLAWIGALLGTLHLLGVVFSIGSAGIIARDIGLLFACTALLVEIFPSALWSRVTAKFFNRQIV